MLPISSRCQATSATSTASRSTGSLRNWSRVLARDGSYRIQKFRRAGALEKGTSNRPRAGRPVDADVGVYFRVDDTSAFDIAGLQQLIKKLLAAAYPQRDRTTSRKARASSASVFKGTGLEVDLVPIVSLDSDANYGLQYSRSGTCVKTSVKVHIDHYRAHSGRDPLLAPSLRMAKRWRNWQELDGIQSFHLELLLSYLIDRDGPPTTGLEESMRRLFLFIMRDLASGVAFDNADASKFSEPVVIVDPANDDNNVAARIHPGERDALVASARQAYETITWAQGLPGKGETISAWKELFGSNFSID